ncbi:hypothetical protein ACER0A_010470 [Haloimpatiens sp. FM7315]|uniref:hypothetical protein n=1 Tax=Haloimpatiens sp. FM7315 TaxID=3298609 RepID=UPI00370B7FD0
MSKMVLEDLNSVPIIGIEDILKLKKYIDSKYKDVNNKKKADILAETIHKILDRFLIGIDKNTGLKIKNNILKETILKGKEKIYLYDILNIYLKEKNKIDRNDLNKMFIWINKYLNNPIDYGEFQKLLISFKITTFDKSLFEHAKNENKEKVPEKDGNEDIIEDSKKTVMRFTKNKLTISLLLTFIFVFAIFYFKISWFSHLSKLEKKENICFDNKTKVSIKAKVGEKIQKDKLKNNIPSYLLFIYPNEVKLKKYLEDKNSILKEEPYFSAIIIAAKKFNINPFLLFAITGQEQNFVPKDSENAKKIANNPFNVFHSWKEYNTNIEDSSDIAARTVFNICKTVPKGKDPFVWINNTYAEDKNWWKGVKKIFEDLKSINK